MTDHSAEAHFEIPNWGYIQLLLTSESETIYMYCIILVYCNVIQGCCVPGEVAICQTIYMYCIILVYCNVIQGCCVPGEVAICQTIYMYCIILVYCNVIQGCCVPGEVAICLYFLTCVGIKRNPIPCISNFDRQYSMQFKTLSEFFENILQS